jgi:hypothetical protein
MTRGIISPVINNAGLAMIVSAEVGAGWSYGDAGISRRRTHT